MKYDVGVNRKSKIFKNKIIDQLKLELKLPSHTRKLKNITLCIDFEIQCIGEMHELEERLMFA